VTCIFLKIYAELTTSRPFFEAPTLALGVPAFRFLGAKQSSRPELGAGRRGESWLGCEVAGSSTVGCYVTASNLA
jgi:hypothetical protein